MIKKFVSAVLAFLAPMVFCGLLAFVAYSTPQPSQAADLTPPVIDGINVVGETPIAPPGPFPTSAPEGIDLPLDTSAPVLRFGYLDCTGNILAYVTYAPSNYQGTGLGFQVEYPDPILGTKVETRILAFVGYAGNTAIFTGKSGIPIKTTHYTVVYLKGITGTPTEGLSAANVPYSTDRRCYGVFIPLIRK
jgi:hypothetical protein